MAKKEVALTKRQLDVLKLVIDGYHNNQIAEMLNVKLNTIERHRATIIALFIQKEDINQNGQKKKNSHQRKEKK